MSETQSNTSSGKRSIGSFQLSCDTPKASVLLLHGLTGAPNEVYGLALELQALGYHIEGPILSGHENQWQELARAKEVDWLEDAEQAFSRLRSHAKGPYFVGGLSFGALLSLYLGTKFSKDINGLVLMAPPIKLKKTRNEIALKILSLLPNSLVNLLWTIKKTPRAHCLLEEHVALKEYPVATLAHMYRIVRLVKESLFKITCPVLLLQDPDDHLVSRDSPQSIIKACSSTQVNLNWLAGGQHELPLGPQKKEALARITDFIERNTKQCQEK